MELKHRDIPGEFLKALPEGIKFIHKRGQEYLVVEECCCPEGHSLMVESVQIHGEPSIKIDVDINNRRGSIYIDSFWGSHDKLYNFIPPITGEQQIVLGFCPSCGRSLMIDEECGFGNCESRQHMVFSLPGGRNTIHVCGRLGCPEHRLEVVALPHQLTEQISEINFFGEGDEDIFQGI